MNSRKKAFRPPPDLRDFHNPMPSFHLTCASPDDLRQRFLALWRELRKNPIEPLTLVVPEASQSTGWRHFLLEQGLTLFNTRFITPTRLRLDLTQSLELTSDLLLGREAMRFLLEQTARRHVDRSPLWKSLARDARPLLQTMDELENSGHRLDDLPSFPGFQEWLADWKKIPLRLRGRAFRDETILARARKNPDSLPGSIVFLGLDLTQLRFEPVLHAALVLHTRKVVLTLNPGIEDESLQHIWQQKVDSWIPEAKTHLSEETLELTPVSPAPDFTFYYAPSRADEAKLILLWIQNQLQHASAESRIAVIFPGPTPLASAVMDQLRHEGIPFHSPFPTPIPRDNAVNALLAWTRLQAEPPSIPSLLEFWNAAESFPGFQRWIPFAPSSSSLRPELQRSFEKFPSLSLAALDLPHPAQKLHQALSGPHAWPDSTTLPEFFKKLTLDLETWIGAMESRSLHEFLQTAFTPLFDLWPEPVSKNDFATLIRHLFERPDSLPPDSAWAPVHLLPPAAAALLRWDALLIAQLNEGDWPSIPHPVSLLHEANRESINAQTAKRGPNEEVLYPAGQAPLLTDGMRYQIERARFSLLRQAAPSITCVASHWDEVESHRELYPSEFYRETWNLAHPEHLWTESIPEALLAVAPPSVPLFSSMDSVATAHHARRNTHEPFGEFQFALNQPPVEAPLSASQAEKILQDPATAWFSAFLDVHPPLPDWRIAPILPLYDGKLLHGWLRQSFETIREPGEFSPLPPFADWNLALARVIEQTRNAFHTRWPNASPWWKSEWPRLEASAHQLLRNAYQLLEQDPCRYLAMEYRLQRPMLQPIPGFPADQVWIGRLDLIALDAPTWEKSKQSLILDFKTGRHAEEFDERELQLEAQHFQLAFYAALVRHQHPSPLTTRVAIVTRQPQPEIESTPLQPLSPIYESLWKILAAAWREGRFGQILPARDRFGKSSHLPVATLEIPPFLLHSKWSRTEPHQLWERG